MRYCTVTIVVRCHFANEGFVRVAREVEAEGILSTVVLFFFFFFLVCFSFVVAFVGEGGD